MEELKKIYKCKCGKEFDKPNSFNAHKSMCRVNLGDEAYQERVAKSHKNLDKGRETYVKNMAIKRQREADEWNSTEHYCEKCGKQFFKKIGEGRFCSRSCANTKSHTEDTKKKISRSVNKEVDCSCRFCGKQYKKISSMKSHEVFCELNPNKLVNKGGGRKRDVTLPYVCSNGDILDVSYETVMNYMESHTTCEICGKTINETVKWDSPNAPKRLCIDHDHNTKKFRGALCQRCNRQLGWYESLQDKVNAYLDSH